MFSRILRKPSSWSRFDGDLLKHVRFSNGFRLVSGARPIVHDVANRTGFLFKIVNFNVDVRFVYITKFYLLMAVFQSQNISAPENSSGCSP